MKRKQRHSDRITVVGEGLVGSLLAIHLAHKDFEVDVFERRPDMRKTKISAGRSINLALSTRGLFALKEVGLDREVLRIAIPMRGRMIHSIDGRTSLQPYGRDESEHINSVSRAKLNEILMNAAESSRRVRIHFDQKAVGADFKEGKLELQSGKTGRLCRVDAPVLLGADGAGSAIRQSMMSLPRYELTQQYLHHGYKELSLPAAPSRNKRSGTAGKENGVPAAKDGGFQLEKNALHIWPRGSYMLIALPNLDGSFTCTLFLPFEGPLSFDYLNTREKVLSFFQQQFCDIVGLIPDLAEQFFANPTGAMVTVRCFPWNVEGKSLLLGDAAHAIVPFYGQGMNCGFEDCTVLGQCIDRFGDDWQKVFPELGRLRKPDADAIAEMAVENFIEMRDKVAQPRFQLEKKVERLLQERFPGDYVSRYSLVTFSRRPYRLAQEAGIVENRILAELCDGIERPEQVDLEKAATLVRTRLRPVLRP